MRRTWLKAAVRLLGPLLLGWMLLRLPDPRGLWRALLGARGGFLALAVVLTFANLQLKIWRWNELVGVYGARLGPKRGWEVYLASSYVGLLTPGRVGDVLRAQYLKRDAGVGYPAGLAAVVVDRLCDLWVLGVFSATAFLRFAPLMPGSLGLVGGSGLLLVLACPLGLLPLRRAPGAGSKWAPRVLPRLSKLYRRLSPGSEPGSVGQFVKGLGAQIRPSLARALGLTLLASLINYGQGWLLARAIGVPLSLGDSAGLLALVSLLGLLPVSISGVGVREAFLSLAFPALGFTAQQGLTFGLLVFGTLYLTLVVSGFAAFQLAPPLASEGEPGTPHG